MKLTLSACIAIVSGCAAIGAAVSAPLGPQAYASTRPRYGGTLRVEMRARVGSLDPRQWNPSAPDSESSERVMELVYDRLVELDENGRAQPALAIAWQHDANFTHWQFLIRDGVKFHDGTPVTAEGVAEALQGEQHGHGTVRGSGAFVNFVFEQPNPGLPGEVLHEFVFKVADDKPIGSGPFRLAEFQAEKRVVLTANEDCWSGRPFVDRTEIQLGMQPQQQALDFELGKVDVVELLPSQARNASRSGGRLSASSPVELVALRFLSANAIDSDQKFRAAISLAIDRASIVNVLLQRQGEPAGSLEPQWISGYAFAFSTAPDVARAKQLRATLPVLPHLTLFYDGSDEVAAQIAERVAVNARDANILITTAALRAGEAGGRGDMELVRERFAPPDARETLQTLLRRVAPDLGDELKLDTPEERYSEERGAVDQGRLVPIAFVPELYGVSAAVHDFAGPKWGGWELSNVWLEEGQKAAPAGGER